MQPWLMATYSVGGPPPAPPDHLAKGEDSEGWSYYLSSLTTQMASQADRRMGMHVLFIAGESG